MSMYTHTDNLTGEQVIVVGVEVAIPRSHARAFQVQMTGNDDDILLAAEQAIRAKIERELGDDGEGNPDVQVELSYMATEKEVQNRLLIAASEEARDRKTYGPYAT